MACGIPDRRKTRAGCGHPRPLCAKSSGSVPGTLGASTRGGQTRQAAFFVNSYAPLVIRAAGKRAAEEFRLPPFIDGSIRREPDLEHTCPSISCLCRAGKFAPRLRIGDVVAYSTKKDRYAEGPPHIRLTALLRVCEVFDSHTEAAAWYRIRGHRLPSNCMVRGNQPQPLEHSHRGYAAASASDAAFARAWDLSYLERARVFPRFVLCQLLWRDLSWTAPRLETADLITIFGKVPGTRNPGAWPMSTLDRLVAHLGLKLAGEP